MVAQFNKADVVAWAFLQVWNSKDPNQAQYQIPSSWMGSCNLTTYGVNYL